MTAEAGEGNTSRVGKESKEKKDSQFSNDMVPLAAFEAFAKSYKAGAGERSKEGGGDKRYTVI